MHLRACMKRAGAKVDLVNLHKKNQQQAGSIQASAEQPNGSEEAIHETRKRTYVAEVKDAMNQQEGDKELHRRCRTYMTQWQQRVAVHDKRQH